MSTHRDTTEGRWEDDGGPRARLPSAGELLRMRIATEEGRAGAWRAAGCTEKYLESCSKLAALELQLSHLAPIRPS